MELERGWGSGERERIFERRDNKLGLGWVEGRCEKMEKRKEMDMGEGRDWSIR